MRGPRGQQCRNGGPAARSDTRCASSSRLDSSSLRGRRTRNPPDMAAAWPGPSCWKRSRPMQFRAPSKEHWQRQGGSSTCCSGAVHNCLSHGVPEQVRAPVPIVIRESTCADSISAAVRAMVATPAMERLLESRVASSFTTCFLHERPQPSAAPAATVLAGNRPVPAAEFARHRCSHPRLATWVASGTLAAWKPAVSNQLVKRQRNLNRTIRSGLPTNSGMGGPTATPACKSPRTGLVGAASCENPGSRLRAAHGASAGRRGKVACVARRPGAGSCHRFARIVTQAGDSSPCSG
jgi:hypothetical protein